MGLQLVSERKRKRACEATGLEIIRLLRHSNRLWMGIVAVKGGHSHVDIDPVSWDVRWTDECLSSCSSGAYGPYVKTPQYYRSRIRDLSEHLARLKRWREEWEI